VIVGTHDYELVRHSPSRTLLIEGLNLRETTIEPSRTGFRPAGRPV